MTAGTLLRHLRRDARGSGARLVFFVACLAVGVAAVVAVAGFSTGLERGIRGQARELLAADLAVRGRSAIPEALIAAVDAVEGSGRAEVRELLTVVAAPASGGAPGTSQLVELKAVAGGYPFYGDLELAPPGTLAECLDAGSAVVAPELLSRLGLALGDALRIGGLDFRIAGTVLHEPDRMASAFSGGPRVFISLDGLARARLEQVGSRITHRLLVRLPPSRDDDLETLADALRQTLPADGRFRLETYRDAQPALRQGLRRTGRFLGLAALLSLVIGGIGIAQTVRAWLAGRMDAIAVLKCLGYRPREVLWLYLGQAAALGLVGSLIGALGGVLLQTVPTRLLAGVVPVELFDPWQPAALARGIALGLGVALLFSAPPLLAARRVPPIRVLRRDAEALPPSRWAQATSALVLIAGVVAMATWQSASLAYGALFTAGLLTAAGVLTLAAWATSRLAARPRRRARLWLRHGLAALARPGAATVGAVVALGLGVLVLLGMLLVERHLDAQLDRDLPNEAPSAFMIDIQVDQWPGIEALLRAEGAERIDSVPVVMARLSALDGRPVAEIAGEQPERDSDQESAEDENRRWALTREQRLTYLQTLPADNTVVAGALWQDPERAELSLEEEFATFLEVGVGSTVTLDIQGVPLELTVTSLRTVDWSTFGINFFLVVEPGVLEDAPQHRIAAARLPVGDEQRIQDLLAARYPNVTLIRIREVLERLASVLARLALGIRVLGGLTVLAGLAILAGAISAGTVRRGAEVALYKTLGMTRRQVTATFATEYALVGLVAGVIGTVGGGVLAWAVLTHGMEIAWRFDPAVFTLAPLCTVALAIVSGLAASAGALRKRPIEVLRGDVGG